LAPIVIIYYISVLAETNRAPFDLPEAEAEIVAGYNIEYSGVVFALFFLGEYCNMILMSVLCSLLFFGGWLPFLGLSYLSYIPHFFLVIKTLIFSILFIVVRANLPRVRYDQLMKMC
jgi:NADH-quinone oxidoreductase subunit H